MQKISAGKFHGLPLCNVGDATLYSALILAARITFAHLAVSSPIRFAQSAGEPTIAMPPRSRKRAFIRGSTRAALTCLLSLATIASGVPLGAPSPYHMPASYPDRTS